MLIVHSALGYFVLLVIAYLIGRRTRSIPWKTLGVATVLQLLLAAILLQPGTQRHFGRYILSLARAKNR